MDSENRMSVRRALIPLVLALFAARCSDRMPPTAARLPVATAPHFLEWAGGAAPQFAATGALPGRLGTGGRGLMASATSGLSLSQYSAAFWAVRGQERAVQLNYLSATGDTGSQFLRLVILDPTYAPGQGDLALGDSVLVTVTVDPTNIKVSLEPTGLQFGEPAQLQMSYGGANGDLNGDGIVDSTDAYIESQLLGLWYREGGDSAWTQVSATRSLADKAFTSLLPHFCEYAVSW